MRGLRRVLQHVDSPDVSLKISSRNSSGYRVFLLCNAYSAFLGRSLYDDDICAVRPGRPRRCGPARRARSRRLDQSELKSSNEVPPVDSKGTGSVTATLDTASKQLSWKGSVTGLSGPATAAHFHSAESGKNGAVVVPMPAPTRALSKARQR